MARRTTAWPGIGERVLRHDNCGVLRKQIGAVESRIGRADDFLGRCRNDREESP